MAQSHTFVEIEHKIISTVIFLFLLIQELQEKVCAQSTVWLLPRKKWFADRLNMNIAGDLDVKPLVNQTKKLIIYIHLSLSRGIMFLRLLSA